MTGDKRVSPHRLAVLDRISNLTNVLVQSLGVKKYGLRMEKANNIASRAAIGPIVAGSIRSSTVCQ